MRFLLIPLCLLCLALSPAEKETLTKARTELVAGQEAYKQTTAALVDADKRAADAEGSAGAVAEAAVKLTKDVKDAGEREAGLVTKVNAMQVEHDKTHSYWGLGGILLGFSILVKHLFVLALVCAGLGIALWVASFFFPVIGVGFAVVLSFFRRIFKK